MRTLATISLLASLAGAASLSGTLKTPGNAPLAGATVSLAATGTTAGVGADGRWQLGGTTGIARPVGAELRATRHLSVVNGRIALDWNGRDVAGRAGAAPAPKAMPAAVAGRASGANEDTLVFAWRGARIGALPVRLDSAYDLDLRLDTVLELPALKVRTSRFDFSGLPFLSFVLTNDGAVAMDSLTVRLFFRGQDTLAAKHYRSTQAGLVEVPVLFRDAFGVSLDLCQAYDLSGYNKPCDDPAFGSSWSWGTLANSVRRLPLLRLGGSEEIASGTSLYAMDIPLGRLALAAGGRVRFDARLAPRSEYESAYTSGMAADMTSTVQAWLPDRTFPVVGELGWYDLHSSGKLPRPILTGDSARFSPDWSLRSHRIVEGSPRGYAGIPTLDKDAMDQAWASQPYNPYICVYRKGVLVSGYPPVVGRD